MAKDKAVDSASLDAGLKAIADAIREKAGTSDALAFPEGMAAAIAGIKAAGGLLICDAGVFEPATDTEDIEIEHRLGKIPDFMFMTIDTSYSKTGGFFCSQALNNEEFFDTSIRNSVVATQASYNNRIYKYSAAESEFSLTEKSIKYMYSTNTSRTIKFYAGVPYYWVVGAVE